jgi:hypothetical protein
MIGVPVVFVVLSNVFDFEMLLRYLMLVLAVKRIR